LRKFESEEKTDVKVDKLEGHAVVVGYDQMAKQALQALEEYYDDIVVIDRDSSKVEELSRSQYEYIYGDFKHGEIRNASRIRTAEFVLSFSPDLEVNKKVVQDASDATVFVKANSRNSAAELYDMGAHYVILKNVMTSERLGNYIRNYIVDPEIFESEVNEFLNVIRWSGRDV
jgi:Trk K+ transport system NAD-binding subunit